MQRFCIDVDKKQNSILQDLINYKWNNEGILG